MPWNKIKFIASSDYKNDGEKMIIEGRPVDMKYLKELLEEQKESLFSFAKRGISEDDLRLYCSEHEIPFSQAKEYMDQAKEYIEEELKREQESLNQSVRKLL